MTTPCTRRFKRDERGHILCPLCKTVTLRMNYEPKGKKLHWFHQCRVCEERFEESEIR